MRWVPLDVMWVHLEYWVGMFSCTQDGHHPLTKLFLDDLSELGKRLRGGLKLRNFLFGS